MIKRVKWLMLLSGLATMLGFVVVLIVAGYRLFHGPAPSGGASADPGSSPGQGPTALLPKGARLVATTTAGDAVIVTIEAGGATEIRSFDAKTLRPQARLRFLTEPERSPSPGGGRSARAARRGEQRQSSVITSLTPSPHARSRGCGLRWNRRGTPDRRACADPRTGLFRELSALPSSSGPGRRPLTAKTGVRVP